MRGNFNNSEKHLSRLGPTRWSNDETGYRIARGLLTWTGNRWVVTLKMDGPSPGGFYIEPPDDRRRRDGRFHPSDWKDLVDLLGVVPFPKAFRYYILPDEVSHVLSVLEENGPVPKRRSRKIDAIEDDLRGDVG